MTDKTRVLSRELIEKAFVIMGRELADQKRFAEVCLFGGSALIFLFEWRKTSLDVDVVIRDGANHSTIIKARNVAAKELNLEQSWLNEQVTQFVPSTDNRSFTVEGVYPSYERPHLRVLVAKPEYLLALKVMALGERSTPDDRDFQDAVGLVAELGFTTTDEVRQVVSGYFPGQSIPLLAETRLDELIEAAKLRGQNP